MKNALVSVYNKNEKLLKFVHFLMDKKYQIISSDGTFQYLKKNGFKKVLKISDVTSFPEILNGRVKSLHPNIYAGILSDRTIQHHIKYIRKHNIPFIDIVLINCYPFCEYQKKNMDIDSIIDFIDIGGPAMIRSAAKNFFYVTPIIDFNDLKYVQYEIETMGNTSLKLRKKLAGKAFDFTSTYDWNISNFLYEKEKFPNHMHFSYKKKMNLRYGENPHQKSAYYINQTSQGSMKNFEQLNGKKLSFNNLRDIDLAWKVVSQFSDPACCTVKHSTPCGVALGKNIFEAFQKTYDADFISFFGGILAVNKPISKKLAEKITNIFLEVIISPSYDLEIVKILKKKKKLIIIQMNSSTISELLEFVQIDGGLLIQESDYFVPDVKHYNLVTRRSFSEEEKKSLFFAQKVVKYVKSNAIVITKGTQTLGISGGQTNRIWAARQAINRSLEKNEYGLVLASDAFFPFRDVVDEVARSGRIQAIIQPGGSIRDKESIQACDDHGIAMAFTGRRSFKH
ncbi:bifunctional phosphoribosylaminoimidazolecarboxamide formyltransferase/IMP cyclohydrolase [Blattabacterium cuenoti]|uniref:bifunctional phosphoribosylaminoimidazolecarboxamide formyltransferase/IMP cyclohydrolase n=1 Tax=Blattabacterium cuenoti TaxID=1653831 RepID=UPI00163CF285|nr:bifunctional phosphoribosylaminoimidazolecarboxamide formyltransferase/IMP cyclohydrolase [Blattabacterium cuenoti]